MKKSSEGPAASKWSGAVKVTIAAPLSQVWEIISDFCGLRRWIPSIIRCEKLEGQPQKPGCIRHVVGSGGGVARSDGEKYSWVKERLLTLDSRNHVLKYIVEDGNMNLNGYVGTIEVSKASSDGSTTTVIWSFEMNPLKGCQESQVVATITSTLHMNLTNLERTALHQHTIHRT